MEKTFRRYRERPNARHAFTEAEASNYLAHQIRVLRQQRGWTQRELAKQLGTTQAAVSRLEDGSYRGVSMKTITALARAFDVAPLIKFVSTIGLMKDRWVIDREAMKVAPFSEEAELVGFEEVAPMADVPGEAVRTLEIAIRSGPTPARVLPAPATSHVITSWVTGSQAFDLLNVASIRR